MRHIDSSEVNRLICNRIAVWFYATVDGKSVCRGLRIYIPPQHSRTAYANDSAHSSGAITSSEMETNALARIYLRDMKENALGDLVDAGPSRKIGLNCYEKRDEYVVGNYVDRAMSRIEEWPFVGDDRAVRVGVPSV